MRLLFIKNINGVDTLVNGVTGAGNQGLYVRLAVPAGQPFWMFPSIPPGKPVGADFTDAPIASTNPNAGIANAENNAAIAAITADPADVLIYEEEDPELP